MGGAPEPGDAGRDAGERIGARRAGEAHRRGRGVLLVVGVQDEDAVHRLGDDRVDLVLLARHREAHVQEVLGVVEIVARIDEGLADRILVGHGRDRRHLRDHAMGGDHPLLRIVDVGAVVIEGRQRADHAAHDRHRMRVAAEARKNRVICSCTIVWWVMCAVELRVLRLGRQLAVQQQVADLHEVAVLGELLDRIAAIEQDALRRRRYR